jgi:hypothetical protein
MTNVYLNVDRENIIYPTIEPWNGLKIKLYVNGVDISIRGDIRLGRSTNKID